MLGEIGAVGALSNIPMVGELLDPQDCRGRAFASGMEAARTEARG
jgi:hypothetical protein